MSEPAMEAEKETPIETFKNVGAVLRYLQEDKGRQIEKSKLYRDIKNGLLRKENKVYRKTDVDRYAGSLPLSTTPDGRANSAEDRQRRKEEAEIRIKEAQAEREERKNAIMDGQYIRREDMYQELAARSIALNTGLKSAFREGALDLVLAIGGQADKTELLVRDLEKLIDAACGEYARDMELEVSAGFFDDVESGDVTDGDA